MELFIALAIHSQKNLIAMKKIILPFFFAATVVLSSCASLGVGSLYTDATMPLTATSNSVGSKVGSSEATNILGLVMTGDAGINAAAKNGGISKISHVDYEMYGILGIFAKMTTVVYGE
jgi:hypothetical protein